MKVVSKTHIGLVRESNQDSLLINESQGLFAVADGMGGHNGGDIASAMTVDTVKSFLEGKKPDIIALGQAVQQANRAVYERQAREPQLSGMGTTFTGIWHNFDRIYIAHVGDSRAYVFRNNAISQITKDHSVVAQYVEWGYLTEEEARVHPYRNRITRAVGTDTALDVDLLEFDCSEGDRFLICSDGLTEYMTNQDIEKAMQEEKDLQKLVDRLISFALHCGGQDNVSVVVAEVTA